MTFTESETRVPRRLWYPREMTTTDLAVPDTEEIQLADLMGEEEARAITARILQGTIVINGLLVESYHRRVWIALGYADWDAWIAGEFGTAPLSLPREKRKEVVPSLKAQGLSLRAIAAVVGVGRSTVANDLADADAEGESPVQKVDTSQLTEEQHVRLDQLMEKDAGADDFLTDEEHAELKELREITAVDAELVDEPVTKGLDGKEYKAKKEPKAPAAPRIPPAIKHARKIASLLQSAQESLNDLVTNKEVYIDADKDIKKAVDEVLAAPLADLLDEFGITVPAKWRKIVGG